MRRVTLCRDARSSVRCIKAIRRPVGTHDLCVRCIKIYSIVALTGTDALRLDTIVRPYRVQ